LSNQKNNESEEYISTQEIDNTKVKPGIDLHQKFLNDLFYAGIHVRLLDDLHAKFIIADGTDGILMSANLSPNSLKKNIETGLILERNEVRNLEYIFDVMYNHADIVKFMSTLHKVTTVKSENPIDAKVFDNIDGKIKITVSSSKHTNLSSCKIHSILDYIIGLIKSAKEYIYIVTWHFKSLNKSFINEIQNAINRGVTVYLYSNTMTQVPSLIKSKKAIDDLIKIGCKSYGDDKNHSKCILSENKGIIFTANVDFESGMTNGFEVGCILDEEERKSALKHVKTLINK